MKNLNNKESLEIINKVVVSRYISNLKNIKCRSIKLFRSFPHTGATNISEGVMITLFTEFKELIPNRRDIPNN